MIRYFFLAHTLQNVLPGRPIDALVENKPLASDDKRTNILVFGTSYDDPNPTHTGGYLTDSIVIVSVDAQKKSAYTISIPRDLWVTYNTPCSVGGSGKVNAAYICALGGNGNSKTKYASNELASKISEISGLKIHYYINVNYDFIKTLTDAVGGIDVDIYSADSRGIYDPNMGLTLPRGINHLDGKTALKLARARNASGGYGLPRSNFDREINQQRIIAALFKKFSPDGSINDVNKAYKLVNALDGNVQTNLQTSELKSALKTLNSLNSKKVTSVSLIGLVSTDTINDQSVVIPKAGLNNYEAIKNHIAESMDNGDSQ